jgi:acyl carrier protein
MDKVDIYKKLTGIFRDVLDEDDLVLTSDLTAADVHGWDSLNHINIVVAAEAAFRIKFKSAELEDLKNVGELVSLIEEKLPK